MPFTTYAELQTAVTKNDVGAFMFLLDADFSLGALTWKARPEWMFTAPSRAKAWNTRFAGKQAFTAKTVSGYFHGRIFRKAFYTHKVLCAFAAGSWPDQFVDHINGDKTDNRLKNLRVASGSQNARNMFRAYGSSRYKGVSYSPNGWRAQIKGDGKSRHIGRYACETAAALAYDAEAIKQHGAFALTNMMIDGGR